MKLKGNISSGIQVNSVSTKCHPETVLVSPFNINTDGGVLIEEITTKENDVTAFRVRQRREWLANRRVTATRVSICF